MSVEVAREFFASMPGEVFNIYIAPLIEGHGWPFDSTGQASNLFEARRWFQMFDRQRVETIRQLSWEKNRFSFDFTLFHPRSKQVIAAIIEHHLGIRSHTAIANVADTRDKFFRARDYIARTGLMPVPVILQYDVTGTLRILDGNHRLAAMASFHNSEGGTVDAWIGVSIPQS